MISNYCVILPQHKHDMKRLTRYIIAPAMIAVMLVCMVLQHHHHDSDGSVCVFSHHVEKCCEACNHNHAGCAGNEDGCEDCAMHLDAACPGDHNNYLPLINDNHSHDLAFIAPVCEHCHVGCDCISNRVLKDRPERIPCEGIASDIGRRGPPSELSV